MLMKIADNSENWGGFSLIELLIVIVITSIAILGSYTLIRNIRAEMIEESAAVLNQQRARNALETISRELRESSPQYVWATGAISFFDPIIIFLTPRDQNKKFELDENGKPEWKSAIMYRLNWNSKGLYKYQTYDPAILSWLENGNVLLGFYYILNSSEPSEVMSDVTFDQRGVCFTKNDDIVTISLRVIGNIRDDGTYGSHTDYNTEIRLRN